MMPCRTCAKEGYILFAWPNHLDRRLQCTSGTAASKVLDVWPALPISLESMLNVLNREGAGGDDIISALEHCDRIPFLSTDGPDTALSGLGQSSWESGVYDYLALPLPGAHILRDERVQASWTMIMGARR